VKDNRTNHPQTKQNERIKADTDMMWALRGKYGVKGLAEASGASYKGLRQQFIEGTFWMLPDVLVKLQELYEEVK
jgi:hypothetical protein